MPRTLTAESLFKSALHYLERYSASQAGVRAVLQRNLKRRQRRGEELPEQAQLWLEQAVEKLVKAGYLNDKAFAETKLVALRRAGASTRVIKMKLTHKGVDPATLSDVLELDESNDEQAALNLARRRRLGPFADPRLRAEKRDKHIAALVRAGFSLRLARAVVAGEVAPQD
jgi:regulatory protein